MTAWQPIKADPLDGRFRLYGLIVTGRTGHQWFDVFYLQRDTVTGDMLETSGDGFSTWSFDDFEVWADAPAPLHAKGAG